ncbi:hypothetical protein Dalk_1340 [Desulfatibacillum aliphaticivorans]|uniref:Uncharacterized protein n=1 Tax=Desulfatibacillum aliphaticivorans TaxID=218208 RepID=B8F9U5_DESAL|nr:hypothetical protein [Desulfatibacillum aliphaticivorans]ACL03041.1 hypothetical protein Dalk_1340 [Desulfatibacillum aliphaticivorans]
MEKRQKHSLVKTGFFLEGRFTRLENYRITFVLGAILILFIGITAVYGCSKSYETIHEAAECLEVSHDDDYVYSPPADSPSEKRYFLWEGPLVKKEGSVYIVWYSTLFGQPLNRGFAFKDVKQKFNELIIDRNVAVVGKYVDNYEVTLTTGEIKSIPLLVDCYVQAGDYVRQPTKKEREAAEKGNALAKEDLNRAYKAAIEYIDSTPQKAYHYYDTHITMEALRKHGFEPSEGVNFVPINVMYDNSWSLKAWHKDGNKRYKMKADGIIKEE